MPTPAQAPVSRVNGSLSHGLVSESDKAISSKNALATALTGRTVLLSSDDAALYEAHIHKFRERYNPVGDGELALVQSLADTEWRLQRLPGLEMGIYALGRLEFAGLFPDKDEAVRRQLIEAKIFLAYKKDLSNLSLREARLRRQREKDQAGLKELQALRRHQEQAAAQSRLDQAAKLYIQAVQEGTSNEWEPQPLGFEFTIEQIEQRALDIEPDLFREWALSQMKREAPEENGDLSSKFSEFRIPLVLQSIGSNG
jgi:hypothetical protein